MAATASITLTTVLMGTAGAQSGGSTTTLPVDNSDLGRIIPLPNSGHKPTNPGDPGGWLQLSLFFMVCAAIIGLCLYVWFRSHKLRAARLAAGADPVSMAKASGKGLRAQPH